MRADSGYAGDESEKAFDDYLYNAHVRSRGEEKSS